MAAALVGNALADPSSPPAAGKAVPRPPAKAATAAVRFWKTELRDAGVLRVAVTLADRKRAAPQVIGSGGPGYLFTNYVDVPAGFSLLELLAASSPRPLLRVPEEFTADTFFTVLVREPARPGDPPRVEVFVDADNTVTPPKIIPAEIKVRNFMPGLKDARVSVGDALTAQFASNAAFLSMRGLQPATYQVRTAGTSADGKNFEWTVVADLDQHRRQTLLIFPDAYGRIRPRLIVDGERTLEAPEKQEGGQR